MQNKANLFLSFCVVVSSLCFGMDEAPLVDLPETVKIQTSDEQTFEVARDVYRFSQTITNMLHDCGEDLSFVPLPNVSADTWNNIYKFLQYIRDNQLDGLKSELMSKELHELSELLTTANYLDIHPLLDCIADVIAQKLIGQENKTNFLKNPNFLANAGFNSYYENKEDQELLPAELSVCVAQKILEHCPGARNYLLHNIQIPCRVLEGHTGFVSTVCVSGDKIISGSWDHTLRVWNIHTGACEHVLQEYPFSSPVSVSGDNIVSGSFDNTLRVWNIHTGVCKHVLRGHAGYVDSVCVSGNRIVSGSRDNTIRVWNMNTGACERVLEGHTGWVSSVCASGDYVVSGSWDNTVRVWNMDTGECERVLGGHNGWVRSVYITGNRIVSGAGDNTIRVWNIQTEECEHVLQDDTDEFDSVCVSGNRIVSGSWDGTVRVWNIQTGVCELVFQGDTEAIRSFCVVGDRIVLGSWDGTVLVWNIQTGVCEFVFRGHTREIKSVCLAGNIIVSGSADGTVRVWNTDQFCKLKQCLSEELTIEQILLLVCIQDAIEQNQKINITSAHLSDIYESLPVSIKDIVQQHTEPILQEEQVVETSQEEVTQQQDAQESTRSWWNRRTVATGVAAISVVAGLGCTILRNLNRR